MTTTPFVATFSKSCFEPIIGFEERYSINRLGEVYNNKTKRLLKPYDDGQGYLKVDFRINKIGICPKLHRLLALQFLPNPNNYQLIDHIDQNKYNNSLDNLRWTTYSVNLRNWVRTTNSGFPNININKWGFYRVVIYLNKKRLFDKTFKTIDEALSERDWAFDYYGIENNCYK